MSRALKASEMVYAELWAAVLTFFEDLPFPMYDTARRGRSGRFRISGQTDVLFEEAADHDLAKHMTQLGT